MIIGRLDSVRTVFLLFQLHVIIILGMLFSIRFVHVNLFKKAKKFIRKSVQIFLHKSGVVISKH